VTHTYTTHSVEDVNARVLLSRILRLDPKERPTMWEIGQDYYFHPSESPQGRKAEFFGKQVFSIFVPQVDEVKAKKEANGTNKVENGEDDESKAEDIAMFASVIDEEFSYTSCGMKTRIGATNC